MYPLCREDIYIIVKCKISLECMSFHSKNPEKGCVLPLFTNKLLIMDRLCHLTPHYYIRVPFSSCCPNLLETSSHGTPYRYNCNTCTVKMELHAGYIIITLTCMGFTVLKIIEKVGMAVAKSTKRLKWNRMI